jgi:hypothetical protein
MSFAQPLYLWALAGMAIPIAIHFLSRKEGRVVKVGSLRHLEESNTSRFKSLRLNETMLLLTRCAMISFLALFLSGASCKAPNTKNNNRWLVIETGIDRDPAMTSAIDSLKTNNFEVHYLVDGFPKSPPSEELSVPDYWKLAEALARRSDLDIIVLSYNRVNGFRLTRPKLPENIRWIPVTPSEKDFVTNAVRINADSVVVRSGHSSSEGTELSSKAVMTSENNKWIKLDGYADSALINSRDTITFSIANDDEHENDARVLRASLRALEVIPAILLSEVDRDAQWMFWLRNDTPEVNGSPNVVLLRPREAQTWLERQGRVGWQLTRRLTADNALRDHFMVELAALFLPPSSRQPDLELMDVRVLPEQMTFSSTAGPVASINGNASRDIGIILIILFFLTWVCERVLALRRNL